jgi:hypothetical protein
MSARPENARAHRNRGELEDAEGGREEGAEEELAAKGLGRCGVVGGVLVGVGGVGATPFRARRRDHPTTGHEEAEGARLCVLGMDAERVVRLDMVF